MTKKPTPPTSREIEAYIAAERKQIKLARQAAQGVMTPDQMRLALQKGLIDPYAAVTWGTKDDGSPFTLQDIQQFEKNQKTTRRYWGAEQGAPITKLIAKSTQGDIDRANAEIRGARLHKIHGPMLHFHVSSSGTTPGAPAFYGVRIRLEEWNDQITSFADYRDAARAALQGRVSIDCNCGRYQYWFRYVATVGRVALTPKEKDFPKIRNPKLAGMCCKHQLKALKTLLTPTYERYLVNEMAKQAQGAGFLGDVKPKRLSKADMESLGKARPRAIEHAKFQAKLDAMEKTRKLYLKKTKAKQKDTDYLKAMEAERRKLKALLRQKEKELQRERLKAQVAAKKAELDRSKVGKTKTTAELKQGLAGELERAKLYGSSRDDAIRVFAKLNGVSIKKAEGLAKELD